MKGIAVVLFLVLVVSASAGLGAFLAIRRWPHADPALSATEALGKDLRGHRGSRKFLRSRMDPSTATGLALTVALAALVVTGVIVGILAWMVRRNVGLVDLDHALEVWADEHATSFSDAVLGAVTHLGDTATILGVGIAISVYGFWRWRKPSIPLFVTTVVLGQVLISNTIKVAIDRARPELRPRATFTGASFPSGHTTAAGATYLAVALVLAIGSSPTSPGGARRGCGVDRGGRRLHAGIARRPLVLRRARRARDQLVLVRHLCGRVRRSPAPVRRTRGGGRDTFHRWADAPADRDTGSRAPRQPLERSTVAMTLSG